MGGKDQGTRFLSFVDAIKGFRHLLTQEDLDRALSLCTGLRGQLKSKFLVLSDDRVLPPYQGKKGKRAHPGDDGPQEAPGKRHQQGNVHQASRSPIPGVSGVQQPSLAYQVPVANMIPQAQPAYQAPAVEIVVPGQSAYPYLGAAQVAIPGSQAPSLPQASVVGPAPSVQVAFPYLAAVQGVAPIIQPPPLVTQDLSQAPPPLGQGFVTVKVKSKPRAKRKPKPKAPADASTPARTTPSRIAKSKARPMDVTSPAENYESCADSSDVEPTTQPDEV